ncbi:hypothetical protein AAE478_009937 [Parahypoxylon ruwenzoriense]
MSLPRDYLDRVYAGVLGKLIGVYLGRPFEGWTHQRILSELGPIRYYVNEKRGVPLVVTDDDVSGTFAFVRALEEHPLATYSSGAGGSPVSAEQIGKTWLNTVILRRSVFWWGGRGVSTEHTAYLNLQRGIPAPRSGAIATNGRTVAEQIGAQIFIDGWALVAPGKPELAAKLAEAAGSVSHDGEAVHAAKLWAAMEAEAFVSRDVEHLLDTGLRFVPRDSLIATLIRDIRAWHAEDGDWLKTRQRIEDAYGYDKFFGECHVVPNHGVMILSLLYGGHSFHEALHIVNTCGWDTDCNSGNIGCLLAIMHGLEGLDGGPDWRGPLADRALVSSADAGYAVNNAARIALDIANTGRKLAGEEHLPLPKDGAQFHFTLPGSVQGFQGTPTNLVRIEQCIDTDNSNRPGLAIRLSSLGNGTEDMVEVTTHSFTPPEVRHMPFYELTASPLVYPGQTIKAAVRADERNTAMASVQLLLRAYTAADDLETLTGDAVDLTPGGSGMLEWVVPRALGSRPVQAIGLAVSNNTNDPLTGTIWLDFLRYSGTPSLTLCANADLDAPEDSFYNRSFVSSASDLHIFNKFVVAQDSGEGLVSYGTREWSDYKIVYNGFAIAIGDGPVGVAVRVRGLRRWYGVLFVNGSSSGGREEGVRRVVLVKALDEQRIELASADFSWEIDKLYTLRVEVAGGLLRAKVNDEVQVSTQDSQYPAGGVGFVVTDGSILADSIEIGPL